MQVPAETVPFFLARSDECLPRALEIGSQLGVGTTVSLYLPEADYPQAHGG